MIHVSNCICVMCENARKRGDEPLPALARRLAEQRGTSIVLLEMRRGGNQICCDDSSALRASDGRGEVLLAQLVALRAMALNAERALEEHERALERERDPSKN